LRDTGEIISSVTFDGAACNLSMVTELGANFAFGTSSFQPYFQIQPSNSNIYVFFFNICHMIKLIRDCLGKRKIMYTHAGVVDWRYFESLHKLQKIEGLRLVNKLTRKQNESETSSANF
jgi:hypothetical protein